MIAPISVEARPLTIPFRQSFKHASAERHSTQSLWVQARTLDGATGFGEGCPREYVTGETIETARAFVRRHESEWATSLSSVDGLRAWIDSHAGAIDSNPAAWTAVELAILDLLGKASGQSIERLLGCREIEGRYGYTAVLGDGPIDQFSRQLERFSEQGFSSYKVKLSRDMRRNREKLDLIATAGIAESRVRADANNLWSEPGACIEDLLTLRFNFAGLEEPLAARDFMGLAQVGAALGVPIMLDESVSRAQDLESLDGLPGRWIVNCRVSKCGGMVRSMRLLERARSRGIDAVLGAHVGETSILTRAGLSLAATAAMPPVALEGAYGTHLLQRDVTDPPLMFGAKGVLDVSRFGIAGKPGLGLEIRADGI